MRKINYNIIYDDKLSKTIYCSKAFAIFSVICAHCVTGKVAIIDKLFSFIGTLGVPLFFLLAGFAYNPFNDEKLFWQKKIKGVVVPWLIWAVITYVSHIIADRLPFNTIELFKWSFGNGTWLYFVPVLLISFLIFQISKTKGFVLGVAVISIISNVLTFFNIINFDGIITNYQNPLNWLVFFALGILLKDGGLVKIINMEQVYRILLVIATLMMSIVYILFAKISYWNPFGIVVELLWSLCILCFISSIVTPIGIFIGKNTYFMYFFHMQFALTMATILNGLFAKVLQNVFVDGVLLGLKPLLTLGICTVMAFVLAYTMKIIKKERLGDFLGIKR